jgi:hypothetical protein
MTHAAKMSPVAMMYEYISNFIKIGSGIQKLIGEDSQTENIESCSSKITHCFGKKALSPSSGSKSKYSYT